MLTRRSLIGLLAAAPLLARPAFAASPEVFADGGLAIRGADPVAFFTDGAPVIGQAQHGLMWKGATWQFASAVNGVRMTMTGGTDSICPPQGALLSTAEIELLTGHVLKLRTTN